MLIYGAICSLDGFIADADGRFDWAAPSAEVHAFVNDEERPIGTYLYGRRMYETMRVWETLDEPEEVMRDYAAIWRAADKVVYSRTLSEVTTSRTRLERTFDADAVRQLKAGSDVGIGGAGLAAEALRAGLVDVLWLLLTPVVVGRGTPVLPDDVRIPLELLDERRFENGVVYVRYRIVQD
jgi:dihydrofolate reductase